MLATQLSSCTESLAAKLASKACLASTDLRERTDILSRQLGTDAHLLTFYTTLPFSSLASESLFTRQPLTKSPDQTCLFPTSKASLESIRSTGTGSF